MNLIEQFEKGKRLISRGKSLGRDTKAVEERVRVLEIQLKELGNGEPNRNTEKVKVTYSKGNLRIEAPEIQRLFLEIKREFPKGSIVLYDGAVYIAFYYLPLVLKVLEERFSSIETDCTIPDLEGVRRCLHVGQVPVEAELAVQLENPITKALLERKSAEEVAEVTRQLKAELRRSRWIDSVWKAAEKASTEVTNEEEFDRNNEFNIVDSKFEEASAVSLANGETQKYDEKGGENHMGFDIEIEDPIEAGVYELTISKVDTKENKHGPTLQVTFELEDSRSLNGLFPLPPKLSNKTGLLFKKALGEFKKVNSDELIGKKVKGLVEHVQRDGRTYVNVTKIL